MTAIALTIAGSDSGGGAGIQADLKTFSALGVYGASVLTALTAQNTLGVSAIHDIPPAFVRAQMDAVLSDLKVNAIKIGMLSRPDVIRTVAEGLDAHEASNVVLDPVMVAASGDLLLVPEAVAVLIAELLPRAQLITPNLPEAARMLNTEPAQGREAMRGQAQALLDLGARAVLLKGGHGEGPESEDLLLTRDGREQWFTAPRHATRNSHGTGCTLSSAIAAGLAKGLSLPDAVAGAKLYVTHAIRAADDLHIGEGHGPVHHFHALWETSHVN
ncbi:hydroxymethylpyrimidine kinase [Pannonibacter phragmitetus]|uniref:bifunctional hydroxymethylpyrimidine kinase/phosphomethylpyrimidine kinase n=1 Tax=Pannonibacter phragmitetus TaxID=121719 RepID=UPI00067AD123|nr:bifunctional hydroxymethylpyrimidine kinase/phosphomethylpyrimidine kinase [Pannonibacter phragmitetus]KND17543.1 hydroxymethylpyrimidine kinase [Pannonibacter phragmitetus]